MHRLLVIACPVFDILTQIDPKVDDLGIYSPDWIQHSHRHREVPNYYWQKYVIWFSSRNDRKIDNCL